MAHVRITVMADEARWQQYMDAGREAYRRGDYEEAIRQTQAALYAEAEPLYERALAIDVKTLGPEHPEVTATLDALIAAAAKTSPGPRPR
jgi:hypothetical protein